MEEPGSTQATSPPLTAEPGPSARATPQPTTAQLVLSACGLMVLAHLALRAWALLPSWFYSDDFQLLGEARRSRFGIGYLLDPYENQFMPLGRLLASAVEATGGARWTTAALLTLVLVALVDAACVWMLVQAFGARWGILAPLSLYLWSAVPLAGGQWWAAALNQLPLHLALFGSVAAWLGYARTRRLGWLALTLLFLVIGLAGYVKTALVFPVLAYLLLAYFASGGLRARVVRVVRSHWPALVAAVVLAGAFAAYFSTHVPSLLQLPTAATAGRLAEALLGTSLATGLLGGPWHWDDLNYPAAGAAPPQWAVHLTWAAVVVLVLVLALLRVRTGRAWLLLAGYAVAGYALVATARGASVGELAGYQYRYLTDVLPVAALCLGLATMPLLGAVESSAVRRPAVLLLQPSRRVQVALVAVLALSGVTSAVQYARIWHQHDQADAYAQGVVASMAGRGPVDLPNQVVEESSVPGVSFPWDTTSRLIPLLVDNARFPDTSTRLAVLDGAGSLRRAAIDASTQAPAGPSPGCGWRLTDGATIIPLEATAIDYEWWVRLSYLGSGDDTMDVAMDGQHWSVPVRKGAQEVYVHVFGGFSSVTVSGLSGTTVCVDKVEVGTPVPGDPL